MIIDEDLEQKTKKTQPKNLDNMSIGELNVYIGDLKAEIIRVEADISKKERQKNSAETLFGKK